jgi:hypothetical protein
MYGASIEKDFQHSRFENEKRKRRLETRSLLETEEQRQQRPRRSLVAIFGRFAPQLHLHAPAGRSPVTPS